MRLSGQSGQALVTVLFVMIMLLSLGGAVLLASAGVQKNAASAMRQKQAYYIAEAGVNQVIALVAAGQSGLSSIINEPYAGGIMAAASCSGPVQGVYTIKCTGKYPDPDEHPEAPPGFVSACTITANYQLTSAREPGGGLEQGAAGYFRRGIWTGSLAVGNGSQINSDIYIGGDLDVASGGSVGDSSCPVCIYTDGSVTLASGGSLYGDIASRGDIDLSWGNSASNNLAAAGDIILGTGNRVEGAVLTSGELAIDGSVVNHLEAGRGIDLENGCTVRGAVKTGGDLLVGEDININESVWAMGDLTVNEGSCIGGNAWVHGNSSINGGQTRLLAALSLRHPAVAAVGLPPAPNLDYYRQQARDIPGHYFSSNQTFVLDDSQPWDEIYYVEGDLLLNTTGQKFAVRATIVASGTIIIRDSQRILPVDEGRDSLVLIAGDRIQMGSNSGLTAFLWAGNSIGIGNSSILKGALISPLADFSTGPVFIKQVGLQDQVILTSWQ